MYFSKPNISNAIPAMIEMPIDIAKYIAAILTPNVTANKTIKIGFSSGLENKNTIIGPKPALALMSPFKKGIVEQEQPPSMQRSHSPCNA
jgi:hypothetical protein